MAKHLYEFSKLVYLQSTTSCFIKMTVNIFIPCIMDQIFPQTAVNVEKVLNHFGIETHYIEEQTCCGQIAYKNGYFEQAQELGEKFIKEFNNGYPIIIPSLSCAVMIRKYYPKIFFNSSQHNELKQLIPKTFEFSDFLYYEAGIQTLNASHNADIAIHTSCSGLRDYERTDAPFKLLSTVKGVNIQEFSDHDVCCGFGGSFAFKNHHISAAMGKEKLENVIDSGAQYLVSSEISCLLHLQSYARKNQLPVVPVHIADFIALILNL